VRDHLPYWVCPQLYWIVVRGLPVALRHLLGHHQHLHRMRLWHVPVRVGLLHGQQLPHWHRRQRIGLYLLLVKLCLVQRHHDLVHILQRRRVPLQQSVLLLVPCRYLCQWCRLHSLYLALRQLHRIGHNLRRLHRWRRAL